MSEEHPQGNLAHTAGQQGSGQQREFLRRARAAPAARVTAFIGLGTHAGVATTHHPLTGRRCCWAHVCRDGEVVCGRVELVVRADTRLGLAPRERRRVAARFVEHLHPALRTELSELVRRRGAGARRAAARMQPIEIVFEDPRLGLQRIIGWIQPPQQRNGDLHEIEFELREPS